MRPAVDIRFVPAVYPREAFDIAHLMRAFGVTKAQAKRQVQRLKEERVFRSTTHQVAIIEQRVGSMAATWLSIKRVDRSPILDRMELAPIADTLQPGRLAVELLPAPWRVVDTANSYHVFCLSAGFDEVDWVVPPHLGDWRELQAWHEASHPRREGALVIAGSPRAGEVMLSPAGACFPFGFESGHRLGQGRGGAVQRPYDVSRG